MLWGPDSLPSSHRPRSPFFRNCLSRPIVADSYCTHMNGPSTHLPSLSSRTLPLFLIPTSTRRRKGPRSNIPSLQNPSPRLLCLSRFRGAEVTFRFRFFPLCERAICSTRTKRIYRKPIERLLLFDRRQPWTDAHTVKKTATSAPIRRQKPLLSRPRLKPKPPTQPESRAFLRGFRFRRSPPARWPR